MKNHIRVQSEREPPEGVLRQLRDIDPTLDLHYLGEGRWAVGAVKPTKARSRLARKTLQNLLREKEDPRFKQRYRLAQLASEGFGVIAAYKFLGEPTSQIVEDVRKRNYAYESQAEMEFNRRMEEAATTSKHDENVLLEEVEYREKNVAPQLFRNAHSVDLGRNTGRD